MAVTAAAGVLRSGAAVGGMGRVRVQVWPAGRRMCAVMVSRVRVTVTSVSSSRAMRLRSRAGVAGSSQIAGRSVASFPDSGFVVNLRCGLLFQILIVDLLRGPVLKSGVPTF